MGRIRGLVPIFLPLILSAIDRADTFGRVLEIRGIARRRFRPEFPPLSRSPWALLGLAAITLISVALFP